MSTLAEYQQAAKDYANSVRARKAKEAQYDTVHAQLDTFRANEAAALNNLITVAAALPSDVP